MADELDYVVLPRKAVADGATGPNPGKQFALAWSTTFNDIAWWDSANSKWVNNNPLATESRAGLISAADFVKLKNMAAGAVSSVFGRASDVVAELGDYAASLVGNDSGVVGVTVKDALQTLWTSLSAKADASGTTSALANKVQGPATSLDNALARWDGTTGKLAQDSVVQVGDTGNIATPGIIIMSTPGATVDGVDVSALKTTVDGLALPSYLALSAASQLTNGRTIAVSTGVQMADGGAGGALTLSSTGNGDDIVRSGTAHTLLLTDAGKTQNCTNAAPFTLTVPHSSTVPFVPGTTIYIFQGNAGQVAIVGATNVVILLPPGKVAKTRGQYSTVRLRMTTANWWTADFDLEDTAGAARGKYAIAVGGATSVAVTHNLNTRDVSVAVYDAATFEEVQCDVTRTSVNIVTLGFTTAPAAASLRCVVQS